MFYETFMMLCEKNHVSPSGVAEAIGLNRSAATSWKRGIIPNQTNLNKLATYFNVTRQYLLDGTDAQLDMPKQSTDGAIVREPNMDSAYRPELKAPREPGTRGLDLKVAFALIRSFHPEVTTQDIAGRLNLPVELVERVFASREYKTFMPSPEWRRGYYSFFSDVDIEKFGRQLQMIQHILEEEVAKIDSEKLDYVICDYLHQHYSSGAIPIEEISISSGLYTIGDKQIVVRFKESEQKWVFFIYPYELKSSETFRFEHQIKATAHYFYRRKEQLHGVERVYIVANSAMGTEATKDCVKALANIPVITDMGSELWLLLFDKYTNEVLFDEPLVDFIDIDGDSFTGQET